MKHLLLVLGLLMALAAPAATKPRRPAGPTPADSVQLRAAHCTQYLTDALRLSSRQALAVRRCAAEQARAGTPVPAWQQFDRQMLGILTPGQYCAFAWLAERMPR